VLEQSWRQIEAKVRAAIPRDVLRDARSTISTLLPSQR